ncbi:hypothetical protein ONE63_006967 [Megalurothrips usitatus]|uniref:Ketosynthase family 3 (KS3) domain-containing protein n=1 Tax=Megalurothrips usitatus TaxID=439358 RepID=A0AAV7XU08_9NEOP|nr:hypothetical protein ONE63_006967 [Megalurothrips usitatus]
MAPIEAVISGIGGAFPQSEGFEGFMNNLMEGKNLSSVDSLRWKPGLLGTSPHVGKIANVHQFDYTMFRVHKGLAQLMDPLARLMLERSMEAVLDAGLSPKDLENTYTSVFMTTTVSESESKTTSTLTAKKHMGYAIMAGSKTMMSNRISYFLKLNGPSITLDGDWTVSLIALQRAVLSIESGESDYALIGAANTCLFPELNKIYENLGVISSDGQCRSLDARGSGCFRSEGAVVFLLQRSDTANRVYARVKGVNELCRGSRYAFVGVDALALSPLIEDLYHSKGLDADDVQLLTSDGISIPEVERDEIEASAASLCKNKSELPVSTAKAVAGHGDAVGALISIIHAITAMETGTIPPLKHFEQSGAKSLADSKLKAVKSPQPVDLGEDSIVAVNTLGYTGCIGHTILKPNTKVKQTPSQEDMAFPRLVILSGRTEEDALNAVKYIIEKPLDPEFIRLTQQAFSNRIDGYPARAVAIVPSENPSETTQIKSKLVDKKDRPVWFVYSGMGSQWAGMGKGLLQLPIFAETIQRLQPVLEPEGIDLTHTITTDDSELFEEIIYSFISIAAIQIGLTNVMKSLGIEPDGIIGHSTGELGCAYGDGCLTEEETLRAAYARGRASTAIKLIDGTMASIGMGWDEARAAAPASVDIACHNSADNCTVSGPTADVTEFVEELKGKNVFARAVNVSNIAFHSRYVQPAGQYLHEYLLEVIKDPKKRSTRWVASSINPGDENKAELAFAGPEFFTNNLLSPVRFKEAMQSVPKDAVVIELAPHGLMQPLIRRGLPDGATCIALTKRGHRDGFRFLLEQVGNIFLECVPVKPWLLAPPVTLPVSRGTPPLSSLATWDHREELPIVVYTRNQVSRPVSVPLYPDTTPCITQFNKRFAAPSAFIEVVWRAVADGQPITNCPVIFSDLEFTNTVEMNTALNLELELQLQRETGFFEVVLVTDEDSGNSICILKGMYSIPDSTEAIDLVSAYPTEENGIVLGSEEVYEELLDHDINYDDELRTLRHVILGEKETSGQCYWTGEWSRLLDSMFQLVALTDPRGSVSCGKIRKVTIAPQEIQALSNVLPVRYLRGPSILAAPGINIENYRRSESNKTAAFAVLNMSVSPLQHQTNEVGLETFRLVDCEKNIQFQ